MDIHSSISYNDLRGIRIWVHQTGRVGTSCKLFVLQLKISLGNQFVGEFRNPHIWGTHSVLCNTLSNRQERNDDDILYVLFGFFIRLFVALFINLLLTSCFCTLIMVITVRWQLAVMVPPTTHHFNGRGNMAYGTNMTNRMYHIRYSRSANPTPSPTKPVKRERETELYSNSMHSGLRVFQ